MNDTIQFVLAHLPPCRLLEIGCGTGTVAAQLQDLGFQVIAIDEDEKAVAEAKQKGVNAITASWPDWQPPHVDAILFTRSLHHIPNTRAAVAHAAQHAPVVLVEDFAYEECAPELIEWFATESAGAAEESFAKRLASAQDRQTFWRKEHDHHLATAREMEDALRKHFVSVEVTDAPYLYRYLGDVDNATVERIAEGELHFAKSRGVRPLGRRYCARTDLTSSPPDSRSPTARTGSRSSTR